MTDDEHSADGAAASAPPRPQVPPYLSTRSAVLFQRGPFRSAGRRDGGVLAEEADELGAGVRPAGVGV
jgi:hypothetical protein